MNKSDAYRRQPRHMTAKSPPSNQVPFRSWIAVMGAILGAFMAVLDIQITNASLKDIQAALGATLEEGSWISTSYLVAEIVVIPLSAWLSRVFSIRWYLIVNAALFTQGKRQKKSSFLCYWGGAHANT